MSSSIAFSIAGLLQWVGPIVGFAWAERAGKSRGKILLAAAAGGMASAFVSAIALIQMSVRLGDEPTALLYQLFTVVLSSVVFGAGIGCVGVFVQFIESRSRRA
jgi:hypothetical protein